jgi:hypothetical protein
MLTLQVEITVTYRKGDGSFPHTIRENEYAFGHNIDSLMTLTNVTLMEPISVRQGMEECFGESIKAFNEELTPEGKKKKPSRQILKRDNSGKPIKDNDGKYIQGNMYDWSFEEELKEVANENKMLRKPSKGGKINPKTGKVSKLIRGKSNYCEELAQFGNSNTTIIGTPAGNLAIEALKYFWYGVEDEQYGISIPPMKTRLPQFYFIAAEIHNDEFHFRREDGGEYIKYKKKGKIKYRKAKVGETGEYNRYKSSPHLHFIFIPWGDGHLRGPDRQIGYNRALKQMNLKTNEDDCDTDEDYRKTLQDYRDREREYMYQIGKYVFGDDAYKIIPNEKKTNEEVEHLDTPDYQAKQDSKRIQAENDSLRSGYDTLVAENERLTIENQQGIPVPTEDEEAVYKLLAELQAARDLKVERYRIAQEEAEAARIETERKTQEAAEQQADFERRMAELIAERKTPIGELKFRIDQLNRFIEDNEKLLEKYKNDPYQYKFQKSELKIKYTKLEELQVELDKLSPPHPEPEQPTPEPELITEPSLEEQIPSANESQVEDIPVVVTVAADSESEPVAEQPQEAIQPLSLRFASTSVEAPQPPPQPTHDDQYGS